mgnify:CR=1 FL=1
MSETDNTQVLEFSKKYSAAHAQAYFKNTAQAFGVLCQTGAIIK